MAARGSMLPALILAALEDGPAHGYLVARRVEENSDGQLGLHEGSLYPVLHALEERGLVQATLEAQGERSRRVYQLTEAGHRLLKQEREAWRGYAAAVERALFPKEVSHATA
jgi:DNA-binding PadR family transcriptional regulator